MAGEGFSGYIFKIDYNIDFRHYGFIITSIYLGMFFHLIIGKCQKCIKNQKDKKL